MTAGSDLAVVSSTAIARVRDTTDVVLYPRRILDGDVTMRLTVEMWTGATVVGRYIDVPVDFDEPVVVFAEQSLVADLYTEQTGSVVSGPWNIVLPEHEVRS
ncbi:hypothetical protein KNV22_gp88 [Gordonia phage Love]|uniref:Uncharacterized protein n=1 Tax=Gordonia phage Love TaxID=2762401 RepID=A0A7G8LKN6_9CAUD|nr:hypothetical protein KNV22_gp88 [Gordonia phage Love]QNJ57808.1 hypothetical protein SEA_LOVE_88 [Gordonia phage Love]